MNEISQTQQPRLGRTKAQETLKNLSPTKRLATKSVAKHLC